jgi:hypothetical protein
MPVGNSYVLSTTIRFNLNVNTYRLYMQTSKVLSGSAISPTHHLSSTYYWHISGG